MGNNLLDSVSSAVTESEGLIKYLNGMLKPTTPQSGNMFDGLMSFLGNKDSLSNLNTGVDALGGLFSIYSGIKGLNQAKDLFNTQKGFGLTNLANEAKLTNERLSTRQASRLRSSGLSEAQVAQGVQDFMKQYGVSGSIGG